MLYHASMDTFITLALIVLATHRLTVLAAEDEIAAVPREWVQHRFEQRVETRTGTVTTEVWQSSIAYMLSCIWCMSIWLGGAVTVVTAQITNVPLPVLVWLAASSVTALLGGHRAD